MMTLRSTPPPQGSYYPSNDPATHRDLLLFEERLKTNAASLKRRKRRYQLFLAQLLLIILLLLSQVFLQLNTLDIPYKLFLRKTVPFVYSNRSLEHVHVHRYVISGLLFVSVTTLVLFFASGMYSEKIGYANRYVPHANRALRNFNMYLNLRQPPLRSLNPLSFAKSTSTTSPRPSRPPSPTRSPLSKRNASSVPIPTIPPSTNPRGELIFSSKVDRSFRDSYERYRATFERRREEREREAFFTKTWLGRVLTKLPWSPFRQTPAQSTTGHGGFLGPGEYRAGQSQTPSRSVSGSSPGRGRLGSTPSGSRRSSPVPSLRGRGSRNGSKSRSGTPMSVSSQEQLIENL